jgi:L-iditol 2-dehydrogenase
VSVPSKMRAAYLEAPYELRVVEMDTPALRPRDLLVRVRATGVCGSDLHTYRGLHPFRFPPAVLGHEVAGDVVAVGPEASGFAVGDRVAVEPVEACGLCKPCAAGHAHLCLEKRMPGVRGWLGSFAEYFVVPARCAYPLPAGLSDIEGSMVEPLAVGHHAICRPGLDLAGRSVVIVGGGTIGLSVLACAKLHGAEPVIMVEPQAFHRSVAVRLGAFDALDPAGLDAVARIHDLVPGGADLAVETAGAPETIDTATRTAARRGAVVVVSLFEKPPSFAAANALVTGEVALFGSSVYTREDYTAVIGALAARQLDPGPMVTHRLPLAEAPRALALVDARPEPCIKVILEP